MPRYILKAEGKYFEWSTIVDAPVSGPMTLDAFKEYYKDRYGSVGLEDLAGRLVRVESTGSSSKEGNTFEDIVECNRFGQDETNMSIEDIRAWIKEFDKD